ncbi:MAG: methyltransferase domain-containing protein [Mycobacteriales bacterium]
MPVNETLQDFLSGARFSNGQNFRLHPPRQVKSARVDYLADLCADKTIIDVGCTDHEELIEGKIGTGSWLHGILDSRAKRCFGVDVSESGVAEAQRLGFPNMIVGDVTKPIEPLMNEHWDLMVMGELIEHIDDPVSWLRSVRECYRDNVDTLVLTTPNAFRVRNFVSALRTSEFINTDHRYWFTPYTLMKVLTLAGFVPEEPVLLESYGLIGGRHRILGRAKRVVVGRYPLLRDNMVITARFSA